VEILPYPDDAETPHVHAARRRAEGKFAPCCLQSARGAGRERRNSRAIPAEHPLNANLNGPALELQGAILSAPLEGRYRRWRERRDTPITSHAIQTAPASISPRPLDLTHDTALLLDFDLGTLLNARVALFREGLRGHPSRDGDPSAPRLSRAHLPFALHNSRAFFSAAPPSAASPLGEAALFRRIHALHASPLAAPFSVPDLPRYNPPSRTRALAKRSSTKLALSRDARSRVPPYQAGTRFRTAPYRLGVRARPAQRHAHTARQPRVRRASSGRAARPSLRRRRSCRPGPRRDGRNARQRHRQARRRGRLSPALRAPRHPGNHRGKDRPRAVAYLLTPPAYDPIRPRPRRGQHR